MLYKPQPDPPQLRHRCRNPRCAGKLKIPAANPRDAFCCRGCERQFYGRRCRVCEALFTPKTVAGWSVRGPSASPPSGAIPRIFSVPATHTAA